MSLFRQFTCEIGQQIERFSTEKCQLDDIDRLEACTRPLFEFQRKLRLQSPQYDHVLLPWLSYDQLDLVSMCATLDVCLNILFQLSHLV